MPMGSEAAVSYGEEPVALPITDLALSVIDNYSELNPEDRNQISQAFQGAVNRAINKAEHINLGDPDELKAGYYYNIFESVEVAGQQVDLVVKILKDHFQNPYQTAAKLKKEYSTMRKYCPGIVLPAIISELNVDGKSYYVCLQRKVENAMSLAEYQSDCAEQGKPISDNVKMRIRGYVQGLRDMSTQSGSRIDYSSVDSHDRNLLVDPKNEEIWLVDSNRLIEIRGGEMEDYQEALSELERIAG